MRVRGLAVKVAGIVRLVGLRTTLGRTTLGRTTYGRTTKRRSEGRPGAPRRILASRARPRVDKGSCRSAPGLAAFTLLELMIVVAILGILAVFVVPKIVGRPDEARVVKAKIEISTLEQQLDLYNLDNGMYPSTEQGLKALVEPPQTGEIPSNWKQGGYLGKKRVPNDPWGNPYVFTSPGVNNPESFDLFSLGKDGKEGGEGTAADITNWE